MITKRPGRTGTVLVTFTIPAAVWADTIHVVGDFNGWDERATPLRQTESGWMITLELEAGRDYHYRYVLNGHEWCNDWNADRYEPNAQGGDNSVVVTPDFARDERFDSERVLSFTRPILSLVRSG
jgi:1,4-alpha-glucan branching enzyme